MSDELDIEAIEARLKAATPGPWKTCGASDDACQCHLLWSVESDCVIAKTLTASDPTTEGEGVDHAAAVANAQLIAHAPEDLRALLAEVRRLTDELATTHRETARLQSALDDHADMRVAIHDLDHLLSAPDSPLPVDIRARVKPGTSIVGTAGALLLEVARERDEALAALQSARVEGARLMREAVVVRLRDEGDLRRKRVEHISPSSHYRELVDACAQTLTTDARIMVRALDPAAVVGSGS